MLADAIRQAQRMHRAVMEATYDGECRIYEMHPVKDIKTKVTKQKEVMVIDNLPCHLSYSSLPIVAKRDNAAVAVQTNKLFTAPERDIKPGTRIEVTQQGRTESYRRSGKPAVYASHQEILLELWEGYV